MSVHEYRTKKEAEHLVPSLAQAFANARLCVDRAGYMYLKDPGGQWGHQTAAATMIRLREAEKTLDEQAAIIEELSTKIARLTEAQEERTER